jgi:TolB protein
MKKIILMVCAAGLLIHSISFMILAQQEIWVGIREGMPMIPVALPDIQFGDKSLVNEEIRNEIYETLWHDLQFSRVFKLVPREQYSYIQKFNPADIVFKDWASIQANILVSGELDISAEDRLDFAFKVYEVNSEKFIFGRNFGGKKEFSRLIAHRTADEIMKYFGEKPIFTSKIVFVSNRDGNDEIYFMDYDGKRIKRITYNDYIDSLPSWSSDNEKIIYTTYKKQNPDLYAFSLYTGKSELISAQGASYSADWSPDGDNLVYTSTKSGNAEIYCRNMRSGKEKRLTFNQVIDTSPNWSPNGREIVFTSQRSGTPQIYIMDAEGTNIRRITYEGTYHDSPAWSPDGSRVAYVSRVQYRFDIYVYNLKTNSIIKLTEKAGRNENPSWSPDGRHLVFSSTRSGDYQLYVMDYDGANLRQLTFSGENKMPKWQKTVR